MSLAVRVNRCTAHLLLAYGSISPYVTTVLYFIRKSIYHFVTNLKVCVLLFPWHFILLWIESIYSNTFVQCRLLSIYLWVKCNLLPYYPIIFAAIDLFAACPNHFDYFPEINECLRFINVKVPWSVAQKSCGKLKRRAQLLTIQSQAKQDIVKRFLQEKFAGKQFESASSLSGCIRFNLWAFKIFSID